MARTETQKKWHEANKNTPEFRAKRNAQARVRYKNSKNDPVFMAKRREASKICYQRNGLLRPSKIKAKLEALEKKLKLQKFLGGACVKCGITDSRLLDFDHIDPKTKSINISNKMWLPYEQLLNEVKKCQLLCPNCHRLKTRAGNENHHKRAHNTTVPISS